MILGVIEGFYGKAWTWQTRHRLLHFLSERHFSHYIYAPKADVHLRKHWQEDWPEDEFTALQTLAAQARSLDICFGVGLSPLSLLEHWGDAAQQALAHRLTQIRALQPAALALLFDDVKGDKSDLAERQADVAAFVQAQLPDVQLLFCPTYYSFDPILPELFGAMPEHYWQQLGELLPQNVAVLWTGDKVISEIYDAQGLQKIAQLIRRKPLLWDNSRVNDGRKTSPYLPIKAMFSVQDIAQNSAGVLVNPMNQAHLAQINLATLSMQGTAQQRLWQAIEEITHDTTNFQCCLPYFTEYGLEQLSDGQKQEIAQCFAANSASYSQEIMQWLQGDYRFEAACLT